MSDKPRYRLVEPCSIATPQLASLVYEGSPVERENIVRKARFPRIQTVAQYQEAKRMIRRFLGRNHTDLSELESARDQLSTLHDTETNEHVRLRHRLDRDCLQAFIDQQAGYRLDRFEIVQAPADVSMVIEGVTVRTRLDASVQWVDRYGAAHSGGIIIFPAQSDDSRKHVEERLIAMSAIVHWQLSERGGNIMPKARLCQTLDLAKSRAVVSPETYSRLKGRIEASCRYVSAQWPILTPPPDYDGPDWH